MSEFGTMSLEFNYLSDVTGKPVFHEKIHKINELLRKLERPDGLYPNYLNPRTGRWGQQHVSIGALGDSFYEYLLKSWIQSGRTDENARLAYIDAMDSTTGKLIQKSKEGLTYFAEMKFGRLEHKMDHLACFSGKNNFLINTQNIAICINSLVLKWEQEECWHLVAKSLESLTKLSTWN